jgi:hypothetical protein
MNEQRFASGQSQGGIIILARSCSQSRREHGSLSPRDCERRLERQQGTFSDVLYATLSTARAVDASVRPHAPRSPSSPRHAPRQPCRWPLSLSALAPRLLLAPLPLLQQAAPVVARPSITYRAYRERPVPAMLSLANTGAPAPTPRASLADMMRDFANAGMNSVTNVSMYLKIVGVTSLSQLCLSEKKEVMSVRLLQFGFTATTWRR